jgi:hypothetical protein
MHIKDKDNTGSQWNLTNSPAVSLKRWAKLIIRYIETLKKESEHRFWLPGMKRGFPTKLKWLMRYNGILCQ